jgi:hypothetical protein
LDARLERSAISLGLFSILESLERVSERRRGGALVRDVLHSLTLSSGNVGAF